MSMEPTVLAWLTAGIAVPAAVLVFALGYVSRAASTAVGLISVLALLALFAYTANIIMAYYSAASFPPDPAWVEKGVLYQRVAAGQLAAASFIIGIMAVQYYMYRRFKQETGDPVEAWRRIVEDPNNRRAYQRARGKAGWRRVSWDEALELIAAALIYTIRSMGLTGSTALPQSRRCRL